MACCARAAARVLLHVSGLMGVSLAPVSRPAESSPSGLGGAGKLSISHTQRVKSC